MIPLSIPPAARVRLMAQALSAALVGFSFLFMLAEGLPRPSAFHGAELAQMVLFGAMLGGLLLGLVRAPSGPILALAAFAGFWAVHVTAGSGARLGGAFALFPIAAALQWAAWWLARRAGRARG